MAASGSRRLVREEVREAAYTLGARRDLAFDSSLAAPCRALEDEVSLARRRLLRALACLHDRTAIHRARDHIANPSKDKRAYVPEVFDLVLSREELLPMFTETSRGLLADVAAIIDDDGVQVV